MTNETKNVPELRFPEFDGEWEKKDFYKCVEIDSKLVNPRLPEYQNLPHIGPGNIQKNTGRILNYNLVKDENLISGKFEFNDGDIIYGKINPQLQKICAPRFRGLASADSYPIKPIKEISNMKFIYYSLFTSRFFKYSVSVSMRTGMPKINRDELGGYKFYTTLLSEQQKIGEFFSKLDRQIELEEQKLAKLEEQKKGYMQKIFSQELRFKDENGNEYPEWEEKMLIDVLKDKSEGIKRGPFGGALKKDIFIEDGYAIYEQRNAIYDMQQFRYFITQQKYDEMIGFAIKPNDIIMSCSGTIGKLSLIPENAKQGIINQALIRFRTNDKLLSNYFLIYMNSQHMQRKILESNPGSAITNLIPVKELKKLNFPIPKINEQQKIVEFFKQIDNFIEKQSNKVKFLKERKQGLLQKMFI